MVAVLAVPVLAGSRGSGPLISIGPPGEGEEAPSGIVIDQTTLVILVIAALVIAVAALARTK